MPTLSPRMQRILMYYALVKLLTEPRVVQRISAGGGGKAISSLSELGVKDHDLLDGLLDDDHTQYLPLTGIRKMTGDFDVDDNNILFRTTLGKITSVAGADVWVRIGNKVVDFFNFAGTQSAVIQGYNISNVFLRQGSGADFNFQVWFGGAWNTLMTMVAADASLSIPLAGDITMLAGKKVDCMTNLGHLIAQGAGDGTGALTPIGGYDGELRVLHDAAGCKLWAREPTTGIWRWVLMA